MDGLRTLTLPTKLFARMLIDGIRSWDACNRILEAIGRSVVLLLGKFGV
jgi:hypothetical protein